MSSSAQFDAEPEYDLVIRPKRGGREDRSRVRYALAFLPMATVGLLRQIHGQPSRALYWVAGAACLGILAVVLRADFFARASLRISQGYVDQTGHFGRRKRIGRADIAEVVEAEVVAARLGGIPTKFLLILDGNGRVLMRVFAPLYSAGDLLRFRDALGASWRELPGVLTMVKARKQVPGAFPWFLAHVYVSTLALIALVSIVLTAAH